MIKRMNRWVFADLSRNTSEVDWECTKAYIARFRDAKLKPRHINAFPIQLAKFKTALYLTGSRLMELTKQPEATFVFVNEQGLTHAEITKVNEKHKDVHGDPEVMVQVIPIFTTTEQAMWNFVTDGGSLTRAKDIFQFDKWRSATKYNLSGLIKTNFRMDLRDEEGKLHKNHPITPHILRHMRAFNVIVNYGVEVPLAVKWFGWTDERMLYYYAHIRKRLSVNNQLDMLKRGGLLTRLQVDLAKAMESYY